MESAVPESLAAPPSDAPLEVRTAPAPPHGGLFTLARFMRRHRMLNFKYGRLIVRMLRRKYLTPYGRRLVLDGLAFIGPGVVLQIGRQGRVGLGRWSWLGDGTEARRQRGARSIWGKTRPGDGRTDDAVRYRCIGR